MYTQTYIPMLHSIHTSYIVCNINTYWVFVHMAPHRFLYLQHLLCMCHWWWQRHSCWKVWLSFNQSCLVRLTLGQSWSCMSAKPYWSLRFLHHASSSDNEHGPMMTSFWKWTRTYDDIVLYVRILITSNCNGKLNASVMVIGSWTEQVFVILVTYLLLPQHTGV